MCSRCVHANVKRRVEGLDGSEVVPRGEDNRTIVTLTIVDSGRGLVEI